jgi:hypothetical protein
MMEDKFTRAERVRLESLAQALNVLGHTATERPTEAAVFAQAERIEAWLKRAEFSGDA